MARFLLAFAAALGLAACAFPDYAVEPDAGALLARICSDGVVSDLETGVDCGEACPPCQERQPCKGPNDCLTLACSDGLCQAPSCSDGISNGSESDRDCGGQCERRCEAKDGCWAAADCTSGVCLAGSCQAPSCSDRVRNGDESDLDCGGSCSACASGAAECTDGAMNGDETGLDCGGMTCAPCGPNGGCKKPDDCSSRSCDETFHCAQPQCHDQVLNGSETDIDCGGTACAGCSELRACQTGADCESGACQSGLCVPAAPSGERISQEGWTGSASNQFSGDKPLDAFDGDPSSIWSTGSMQQPGMFFELDLGALRAFYAIELECSIVSDVPASLQVYLWQSTEPTAPVRTHIAGFPQTTIEFATPQIARHIRFMLAENKNAWWCINEIHLRR